MNDEQSNSGEPLKTPFHKRQKLIRCVVTGADGQQSIRMVELESYQLWKHLMINKHGLKIGSPCLCLWLFEEEYQQNKSIYYRSGEVERVNRIIIEIYDDSYGFTNVINRFVTAADTDKVVGILSSHIPMEILNSDCCDIEIVTGRAIEQRQQPVEQPLRLGLNE